MYKRQLTALSRLESLNMSFGSERDLCGDTPDDAADVPRQLAALPRLRALDISGRRIEPTVTAAALAALTLLTVLEANDMRWEEATCVSVVLASPLPHLLRISLLGGAIIDAARFGAFLNAAPGLRELDMSKVRIADPETLASHVSRQQVRLGAIFRTRRAASADVGRGVRCCQRILACPT